MQKLSVNYKKSATPCLPSCPQRRPWHRGIKSQSVKLSPTLKLSFLLINDQTPNTGLEKKKKNLEDFFLAISILIFGVGLF